jgi:hypothetical protein
VPNELISILYQLPIVAIFIWYSDRKDKQFQDFLREERAAREKSFDKINTQLEEITDCVKSRPVTSKERSIG